MTTIVAIKAPSNFSEMVNGHLKSQEINLKDGLKAVQKLPLGRVQFLLPVAIDDPSGTISVSPEYIQILYHHLSKHEI